MRNSDVATARAGHELLSTDFLTQLERLTLLSRRSFRGRVKGELSLPGLSEEVRLIVREEVAQALEIGGAGGYLNAKSAASYLDTSSDAIKSMVRDRKLRPIRRRPYMLFTREELDRVATTEPDEWAA